MLRIVEWDEAENHRTLRHSTDVFHKALRAVLNGETRFHVVGAPQRYDLVYESNNDFIFSGTEHAKKTLFAGELLVPPYFLYDENDGARLQFNVLERYDDVVFERANEYTVVLAALLLRLTDKEVYFLDERAGWFIPDSERFHLGAGPSGNRSEMRVCEEKVPTNLCDNRTAITSIFLFQEVFMLQWLCGDLPLKDIKYAEICVKRTEGIGALLQYGVKCAALFEGQGVKTVFKAGGSRYSDEMLKKYFRIEMTPEDSDESNTIYLVNYMALVRTYTYVFSQAKVSYDVLNPAFVEEMDEYAGAVLRGRRMLGVLYRGTDYVITFRNMPPHMPYTPVSVEDMIPVIRSRMERYGYEGIFLATEDEEALRAIREAFPDKVITVAQERFKTAEFAPGQTISELEKESYDQEEYADRVADMTVNYFYALYALSRCDGFLASTLCSGVNIVRALNGGRFERDEVVREMIIRGELAAN